MRLEGRGRACGTKTPGGVEECGNIRWALQRSPVHALHKQIWEDNRSGWVGCGIQPLMASNTHLAFISFQDHFKPPLPGMLIFYIKILREKNESMPDCSPSPSLSTANFKISFLSKISVLSQYSRSDLFPVEFQKKKYFPKYQVSTSYKFRQFRGIKPHDGRVAGQQYNLYEVGCSASG